MLWPLWKLYLSWVVSRKTRKHWFPKEENSPGETRCKKSWEQFEEYDSLSLRYVKQVSAKRTIAWKKYKSNILISEVPTLWNLRTGPMKRLTDNSDAPEARLGTLPKTYELKEKDKATFHSPAEEWVLPAASTKEPEERKFGVGSGASMHMVSKRDFNSAELETMRTSRNPTTMMTANGEVQTREEATENVKEFDLFVTVMLLEETPSVLSLRKLCEDDGYSYHWTSGQKPHLTKKGKRIHCSVSNYVPFVVPGWSTSSSTMPTLTSSSSSSQDSVFDTSRYTENPVPERSGSMSEELRGNPLHKPTETEEVQSDLLHDLPDCLQKFRENLVDESSPSDPRWNLAPMDQGTSSSSHSRAKVEPGSGKQSVYTHFPKDPNCDICLKRKIMRASCRGRAGTVVPRADNFGDLITADPKIFSEGSESRKNHRYAVVVQDLATLWLQFSHLKQKHLRRPRRA